MNKKLMFYAVLLAIIALLTPGFSKMEPSSVNPGELRSWIEFLSSDKMRGRANGSPEMKIAAEWISSKFAENGLKPILADGSYIQNYSFTSRQQKTIGERNVIGYIEGSDPALKDQYLIISSHFDHIGVRKGSEADSIYNGADDNAAGTCTLIGIARNIMNSGVRPGRSIIFASFSGEESGMRGSRYFVANPPVPLKNIYADINFEMIGHSEFLGKNNYYMTGCTVSQLDDVISKYNAGTEFKLIDTIKVAERLFSSSDNIAFSRVVSEAGKNSGIPSGTFATTAEADYIHSPADESKLFDYDNMAALVNHFTGMILWLSNSKEDINFTSPNYERVK